MPEKFESTTQPGLFFWAEPNDIDGGTTWVVVSQVKGYPATEACDDWFAHEADAKDIAKRLAEGKL